ncbi:erythromycin esterase family protein [Sphingomonas sp.]|jgi:erythromycin esterase-like protein|uniref:erythromycin esterase family protein n=1 Tax=Sphingomonas sp. TaxID=28214 RepID=UPI002D7E3D96|nr:erythromycin esterase family protein [Sphingomonas sp.]HEU0045292.1 erythromycin esterase family protein [Sphingomonas sp.]
MASPSETIAKLAEPLPSPDHPSFGRIADRFADARLVLLGEASHGTAEFYRARAEITKRLIAEHGFTIVAVEADWPDAAAIDRRVRGRPARALGRPFARFPTWMWRNTEVDALVRWMTGWNRDKGPQAQAGFYGLDLYNMADSTRAVIDYLDRVDPEAAQVARNRYGCLTPWRDDPARYGRRAMTTGFAECEDKVVDMLLDLFSRSQDYGSMEDDDFLDAAANAKLVADAEAYYRVMYHGAAESWNLRDTHMADTLDLILAAKGDGAKVVVWAHNSHLGDARATDMGRRRGELNLGQLARERHGKGVRLVGFGTHSGTVAAASDWDAPMEVKTVRPSLPGSVERLCHDSGVARFALDLRAPETAAVLDEERLERFIGVIYRPETERWSHYAESVLAEQFDHWIWFDETRAVTPLDDMVGATGEGSEEMWPFGV